MDIAKNNKLNSAGLSGLGVVGGLDKSIDAPTEALGSRIKTRVPGEHSLSFNSWLW
jgi:hypothetical protein